MNPTRVYLDTDSACTLCGLRTAVTVVERERGRVACCQPCESTARLLANFRGLCEEAALGISISTAPHRVTGQCMRVTCDRPATRIVGTAALVPWQFCADHDSPF